MQKVIAWGTGTGNITVTYGGQGDGSIVITSDNNNLYTDRSKTITVKTTDGSNINRTLTITQAAKQRIDISTAVVTAPAQTYTGSALTPTPTVTLNGVVIASSNYDVAYSSNINAGSGTITVTGKGDYTGTATGTFTINKAAPTYTAPTKKTGLTYNGSAQALLNAGSTSHGTIYYSSDNITWSTSIPTQTNANTSGYTVYWKLTGDSNHSDIASTAITGITIAKASRTLSFTDAYAVVAPSGTVTKTATPSAGSGDGAITYSISSTTYATINTSTGAVTAKTSEGSAVVTATIAAGTNYLSATASYNLYVFATTHNFAYTGSVQNITLPPGSYKLQCWGAQGGSNAADATYGITAQAGGKGGYAEGVLTIAAQTTLYAFVGGQPASTSGNGGWNCGGGSTGSTTNSSGNDTYLSKMGCGGGATDFALTTSSMSYSSRRNNRSSASLLSRIIVAGGGSGGAMVCKRSPSTTTEWQSVGTIDCNVADGTTGTFNGLPYYVHKTSSGYTQINIQGNPFSQGTNVRITRVGGSSTNKWSVYWTDNSTAETILSSSGTSPRSYTHNYSSNPLGASAYYRIQATGSFTGSILVEVEVTVPTHTDTLTSQVGYAGGGVNSEAFSVDYIATQDDAGAGGAFGLGANQTATTAYIASGAGGAGWYGGGRTSSGTVSTSMNLVKMSGGGSGFANTAANAQYRPSGYTGIELDSGSTTIGTSSFPSTGGGTETGHAGNGYAKITRL